VESHLETIWCAETYPKACIADRMANMSFRGSVQKIGMKEAYHLMMLYPERYNSPVHSSECIESEGVDASVHHRFRLSTSRTQSLAILPSFSP
jgi:hypothetical protein